MFSGTSHTWDTSFSSLSRAEFADRTASALELGAAALNAEFRRAGYTAEALKPLSPKNFEVFKHALESLRQGAGISSDSAPSRGALVGAMLHVAERSIMGGQFEEGEALCHAICMEVIDEDRLKSLVDSRVTWLRGECAAAMASRAMPERRNYLFDAACDLFTDAIDSAEEHGHLEVVMRAALQKATVRIEQVKAGALRVEGVRTEILKDLERAQGAARHEQNSSIQELSLVQLACLEGLEDFPDQERVIELFDAALSHARSTGDVRTRARRAAVVCNRAVEFFMSTADQMGVERFAREALRLMPSAEKPETQLESFRYACAQLKEVRVGFVLGCALFCMENRSNEDARAILMEIDPMRDCGKLRDPRPASTILNDVMRGMDKMAGREEGSGKALKKWQASLVAVRGLNTLLTAGKGRHG